MHVINFDVYKPIGTHSVALHVNGDDGSTSHDATHFDSFGVKYISKEIKKFIENKIIFRIKAYDLIMCAYFCIRFIDFVMKITNALDYTNLFSPNKYEMTDKIIIR